VLTRQDGSPALTLTTARAAKDGVVARCVGIETKEAADALRGLRLYVPRSALPEPDEDEFYLTDLIGLTVRHVATNDLMGKIKSVQNFGADDMLEITPALGGQTWYLPFTRAAVPEVKIAERSGPGRSAGDGRRAEGPEDAGKTSWATATDLPRRSMATSDGKWRVTASRQVHKDRWISLRADDCVTDEGAVVAPFYVLEYPDWVDVVASTPTTTCCWSASTGTAWAACRSNCRPAAMDADDVDPVAAGRS
jgi:16S rRNA processing protein RimM